MADVIPIEEATRVEDITCVVDCGDPGIVLDVGVLAILLLGGLLMRRWRDTFYVGLVGLVFYFFVPPAIHYVVTGWAYGNPSLMDPEVWTFFAVIYGGMVAIAAAAHAAKRGLSFLVRSAGAGE
jgi:hypothetical protein